MFSRDDAVYDELKKPEDEKKALPLDEDLPGMGQYYCLHCELVIQFHLNLIYFLLIFVTNFEFVIIAFVFVSVGILRM